MVEVICDNKVCHRKRTEMPRNIKVIRAICVCECTGDKNAPPNKMAGRCASLAKFGAETSDGVQWPAVHLAPAKNALPRPTPNAVPTHVHHVHNYSVQAHEHIPRSLLPIAARVIAHRTSLLVRILENNSRTTFIARIILVGQSKRLLPGTRCAPMGTIAFGKTNKQISI